MLLTAANFTQADFEAAGYDETSYGNLKRTSSNESTHVSFLTGALRAAGATPVEACQYSFGVTDVNTFLATALVLEDVFNISSDTIRRVGLSAYLGAADDIMSKTYLTAAGSILTVEARHSSYIRTSLKQTPYPQPFDSPLSINSVYTLAAQFITSCPSSNPALPVKAFPVLAAPSKDVPIKKGSTVMLSTPGYMLKAENDAPVYGAFITVTGPVIVNATMVEGGYEVILPKGVNGQSYTILTGCVDAVNDDTVAAGLLT
ncbi:hypothetical protein H2201_003139 [Coniosporium apollinis]|uniref:Uncharacterized protein n=1 Tax=Coniosporium apollinis TaxID=61459 RepID=A0ABQ9NWH5_9PEZI|nr:hypothetical protein H2201_003139 [Coniosporium apollinis]